jgi:hypothetical protein
MAYKTYGTLQAPMQAIGDAYGTLQSPFGLGALPVTGWCSDRNPQGKCKPLVNICKPMDLATLAIIKTIQRQSNALLKASGNTLLDVDGRVGSLTTSAVNRILGTSFTHCDEVMQRGDEMASALTSKAASVGVTPPPDPKSKTPPSKPGPGNTVVHPPNSAIQQAGFTAMLTSPIGIAALVVGGLLIWKATQKPKKKKRATKRRRRTGRLPKRRVTTSFF